MMATTHKSRVSYQPLVLLANESLARRTKPWFLLASGLGTCSLKNESSTPGRGPAIGGGRESEVLTLQAQAPSQQLDKERDGPSYHDGDTVGWRGH